jgi:uncharacterized protein (DUF111 family)
MNFSPEFEDCRAAAEKHRVGLREAQVAAAMAYTSLNPKPKS